MGRGNPGLRGMVGKVLVQIECVGFEGPLGLQEVARYLGLKLRRKG